MNFTKYLATSLESLKFTFVGITRILLVLLIALLFMVVKVCANITLGTAWLIQWSMGILTLREDSESETLSERARMQNTREK
jgi:hypothetical protein